MIALRACDNVLKALHPAGELAYGMGSLSDVGFHAPSPAVPREAVRTWREAAAANFGTDPLWLVARVLRGAAARVAVTFLGATGAVTLGQVLAKLLTQ